MLIIDQNEIVIYQYDESGSVISKKSSLHGYKIAHLNVTILEAIKIVQEKYISKSIDVHIDSGSNNYAQAVNSLSNSTFSNVNINYVANEKLQHNIKKKNEVIIL